MAIDADGRVGRLLRGGGQGGQQEKRGDEAAKGHEVVSLWAQWRYDPRLAQRPGPVAMEDIPHP